MKLLTSHRRDSLPRPVAQHASREAETPFIRLAEESKAPLTVHRVDLKSAGPQEQLLKIRHALVDRIWFGMMVVALVGAPISVSRAFATGWLPLYGIHIALAILVVGVFAFRAAIPFSAKSVLILLIFWAIGLAGVFTLGILGSGYWWLVLSSLLVSTLYSIRAGVVCAVAVTAVLAAAGAGFISGALKVAVDANVFIQSTAAWATLVIATIVTPFIVFQAIAAYQRKTLELLDEVHRQRDLIEQLATHDQLTGLPLMHLATDRLDVALHTARRSGKKVALLFVDLDGFKEVNDSLGHEAGDQILKEVAARLLKSVRAHDTVARVGGDEFIAILGALPEAQTAAWIAQRAIGAISAPMDYKGQAVTVGASIGISLFPDHADDAPALRKVADAAMYSVKRSGKNRFAFGDRTSSDPARQDASSR